MNFDFFSKMPTKLETKTKWKLDDNRIMCVCVCVRVGVLRVSLVIMVNSLYILFLIKKYSTSLRLVSVYVFDM